MATVMEALRVIEVPELRITVSMEEASALRSLLGACENNGPLWNLFGELCKAGFTKDEYSIHDSGCTRRTIYIEKKL